jgi:hypothetical protein
MLARHFREDYDRGVSKHRKQQGRVMEAEFESLAEGTTLHKVGFKVRPAPGHPRFYEWQFGILAVWLFASSPEDAQQRALTIVKALPYEIVGSQVLVETEFPKVCDERIATDKRPASAGWLQATHLGIGIALFCTPTGTDETEFEQRDDWSTD